MKIILHPSSFIRSNNLLTGLMAVLLGLLSISVAQAQLLPAAHFQEFIGYDLPSSGFSSDLYYNVPGTFGGTYSGEFGTVQLAAQISAAPVYVPAVNQEELATSLKASVSGVHAYAFASLDYSFEIVGPASDSVPLIAEGAGNFSISDTLDTSFAEAQLMISGQGVYYDLLAGNGSYDPVDSYHAPWSIDSISDYQANTVYYVDLHVAANQEDVVGGTATATIDPTMYIDPTFPDASEYSIEYSSNLDVPEPSTWALMQFLCLLAFVVFAPATAKSWFDHPAQNTQGAK